MSIKGIEKIKIGPMTWKLAVVLAPGDLESAWGAARSATNTIELGPEFPVGKRLEVVLHELLHAIWMTYSAPNTLKYVKQSEFKEELLIKTLGVGLAALFTDNPKLLKWFVKEASKS